MHLAQGHTGIRCRIWDLSGCGVHVGSCYLICLYVLCGTLEAAPWYAQSMLTACLIPLPFHLKLLRFMFFYSISMKLPCRT